MTLSCSPTAQTPVRGMLWLWGWGVVAAVGVDVFVCVCVRRGRLRNGVKRCRGACVMSLWKSINCAACTARRITHAYKCTRTESRREAWGLHGAILLLCYLLRYCLCIWFKNDDIRQDGKWFHCGFFFRIVHFKPSKHILSIKSLLIPLAVLDRMNIQ